MENEKWYWFSPSNKSSGQYTHPNKKDLDIPDTAPIGIIDGWIDNNPYKSAGIFITFFALAIKFSRVYMKRW
jgi:hypothetical protein